MFNGVLIRRDAQMSTSWRRLRRQWWIHCILYNRLPDGRSVINVGLGFGLMLNCPFIIQLNLLWLSFVFPCSRHTFEIHVLHVQNCYFCCGKPRSFPISKIECLFWPPFWSDVKSHVHPMPPPLHNIFTYYVKYMSDGRDRFYVGWRDCL